MHVSALQFAFKVCNSGGDFLFYAFGELLVKTYRNRGGRAWAGVVACMGLLFFATDGSLGQTNSTSRARDDKSAVVNLAIQLVQQLQAQQQTNLHAMAEIKQQAEASTMRTAESVSSLRRLILLTATSLAIGLLLLLLYEQRQFRTLRQRLLMGTIVPTLNTARPTPKETAALVAQLVRQGQTLLEQKQAMEALAAFNEALALDPSNPEPHARKGLALEQLGRLEDALASFDNALTIDPGYAEAWVGKGDVFNRLERYEDALVCFDRATRLQPKHAPVS